MGRKESYAFHTGEFIELLNKMNTVLVYKKVFDKTNQRVYQDFLQDLSGFRLNVRYE